MATFSPAAPNRAGPVAAQPSAEPVAVDVADTVTATCT
jgi:hypothetical protein